MKQFPASINLSGRYVPVIGAGEGALNKARLLLAAEADVHVIHPDLEAAHFAEITERATLERRLVKAADFENARVVFIAVEAEAEARAHADAAHKAGALVNVVDQPTLCDFTTPSIIDRDEVTVAISTNGAAPVLGRRLRAQIEALLPKRIGDLAAFAKNYRASVKAAVAPALRKNFWQRVFEGPVATKLLAGDNKGAHDAMLSLVNRPHEDSEEGVVHIVGAGPGDPDLLTLKALRILQSADVILYDRLVGDDILSLARRDAERFYVGKEKSNHSLPQREIEARMISFAREGKVVVRLKGGDPFVFGRGGEELDALRAAGIAAYVTPGITAAIACGASAGMPLTHRDYAQAVTFVTGHAKGDGDPDLDWSALATLKNTLVVYMGVGKAGSIAANLIDHGRGAATPIAIIENGACDNQIIIKGTLEEAPALIARHGVKGPAIIVIGEVAALANEETLKAYADDERLSA